MPIGKPMKKGLRDQVLERDNRQCVRSHEGTCQGRKDTMEHAFGRKYERLWNVITLCAYHAGVDNYDDKKGFNKEINKYHAYKNATDEDLKEFKLYPQMQQEKKYLTAKYETVDNSKTK